MARRLADQIVPSNHTVPVAIPVAYSSRQPLEGIDVERKWACIGDSIAIWVGGS
jgi:hypothetical protein